MKLAIRIFALSIAVAGFAAAAMSSPSSQTMASRQAVHAGLPIPTCGPTMGCTAHGAGVAAR